VVGRYVSQGTEIWIVLQRQCSFLGKFRSFRCSEAVIGERRFRVDGVASRVERAMGIENTAGAHSPFGIMKLQARRELRTIFV
jgi:hypothetical protein